MSQLVACRYHGGIVMAADRRVAVTRREEDQVHSVQKLFALGSSAAVATSGAAVGIAVSRNLHRFFRGRSSPPLEDLEAYAMAVFQQEYAEFVRQGAAWFRDHPDAHRLSYVLLGGRAAAGDFSFRFYASESHHEPYRPVPTGDVLTAPRRLGLEARLSRAIGLGTRGEEVLEMAVEGLRVIARKEEAVGGPFDYALLGRDAQAVGVAEG